MNTFAPLVSFALLLASVGTAVAEDKSDFERASRETGCASIPYSSLRSRCQDAHRDVDAYCKVGRLNCDALALDPLKRALDGMKTKRDSLKRERDDLKRAKKDDETKTVEKQIDDMEGRIRDHERKIDTDRREIERRIDQGERCIDAREKVEEAFKDAKSKAKSERDPEIRPIAEQLADQWEKGERGHSIAIEGFKRALQKCKDAK